MVAAVIVLSALSAGFLFALVFAVYKIKMLKNSAKKNTDTDEMTGLPTRDEFMRLGHAVLEGSKSRDGKTALIVFDVEQLGLINTLFGTVQGDSVVRAFADTARQIAEKGDVIGRVNTDDFALLTHLRGKTTARDVVERFAKLLPAMFANKELREQVNFRAGICDYDGQDDIYTLYNKANLCLLMRHEGVRVTEFTAEMESKMVENELLRSEISDALEHGQFELYYQPKVSFKTGEILGVEALIRWNHPSKGFIPPAEFIPLSEQSGIITRIDEWGLMAACRQCKRWQDMGLRPIKMSVNMSQAQFVRTDVFATVSKALSETGLDPKYLEIEVTETMAMTDVDHTVDVLSRIHGLGVSISMDDFGTGYSSLASLKAIPFDVLKIDRSLVCDVNENDTSRRITGAIVAMGKALRMVVLAEGVETGEQNRLLTEIGCDLAQGYYYSKPRPASEIEALLILPADSDLVV